jgi:hypothetical protein
MLMRGHYLLFRVIATDSTNVDRLHTLLLMILLPFLAVMQVVAIAVSKLCS